MKNASFSDFEEFFPQDWVDRLFETDLDESGFGSEFWERFVQLHLRMLESYLANHYRVFCEETGQTVRDGLLVSLSGGVDSSTNLLFATRYGDEHGWKRTAVKAIVCVRDDSFPAEIDDNENAFQIAAELGVTVIKINITGILTGLVDTIAIPDWPDIALHVGERICRARGLATYTAADREGLVTFWSGNFSEDLLGQWTTGEFTGQFGLLNELFKTEVFELAAHLGVPSYIRERPKITSELPKAFLATSREEYACLDPLLFRCVKNQSTNEAVHNRVFVHRHRAYSGAPNIEVSGNHLDPRMEYAHRLEQNPLTRLLDALRGRRWGDGSRSV